MPSSQQSNNPLSVVTGGIQYIQNLIKHLQTVCGENGYLRKKIN